MTVAPVRLEDRLTDALSNLQGCIDALHDLFVYGPGDEHSQLKAARRVLWTMQHDVLPNIHRVVREVRDDMRQVR